MKDSLSKAYVGFVHNSGSSYYIQERFFSEGYFAIKVTPMGENMCLLEESEEGEICDLICEAESWWKQWFQAIRPWRENDIDKQRVSRIRILGVTCHAWAVEFFEKLVNSFGIYVCSDDDIVKRTSFGVARMSVCLSLDQVVAESCIVKFDGVSFSFNLKEECYVALILMPKYQKVADSE